MTPPPKRHPGSYVEHAAQRHSETCYPGSIGRSRLRRRCFEARRGEEVNILGRAEKYRNHLKNVTVPRHSGGHRNTTAIRKREGLVTVPRHLGGHRNRNHINILNKQRYMAPRDLMKRIKSVSPGSFYSLFLPVFQQMDNFAWSSARRQSATSFFIRRRLSSA